MTDLASELSSKPLSTSLLEVIADACHSPQPIGLKSEFERAIKILYGDSEPSPSMLKTLHSECRIYLNEGNSKHGRRTNDERATLNEISELSKKLSRKLGVVAPELSQFMSRIIAAQGFEQGVELVVGRSKLVNADQFMLERITKLLEMLAAVAAITGTNLPPDRGGSTNFRKQLRLNDPLERFMKSAISAFAEVRGPEKVTKTIPEEGQGRSCYAFIYHLHLYANGDAPAAHKEYRELVDEFRTTLPKSGSAQVDQV